MSTGTLDKLFLDTAVKIADAIDGDESRNEILSFAAVKYAEAADLETAVAVADTINDSYQFDHVLGRMAAACISNGTAEQADGLLEMIQDDGALGLAIEQMAVAHAESGALESAIDVAKRSSDTSSALSSIALACVARGLEVEALEVIRTIDYPDLKTPPYIELAARKVAEEHTADAAELLTEAGEVAKEIEFFGSRIDAWIAIAALYRSVGEKEKSAEILFGAAKDCEAADDIDKDGYRAKLAGALASIGQYEEADRLLEEIENPFDFAHATALVGFEYYNTGDKSKAIELWAEAFEIVRDEDVFGAQTLAAREGVLYELARYQATAGHPETALKIVEAMNAAAQQDATVREIAALCVATGNHQEAFRIIETIPDPFAQLACEVGVFNAFISAGQLEMADKLLPKIHARAAAIDKPYQQALALGDTATCMFGRDQTDKGSQVLFDALSTIPSIEDRGQQARALIVIAGVYSKLDQPVGGKETEILDGIINKLD